MVDFDVDMSPMTLVSGFASSYRIQIMSRLKWYITAMYMATVSGQNTGYQSLLTPSSDIFQSNISIACQ